MNQIREQVCTEFSRHPRDITENVSIPDESGLPMHAHHTDKMIYAEGGTVYVLTEDKTWYLLARHYIWVPKDTLHCIRTSASAVTLRALFFETLPDDEPFFKEVGVYPINDLLMEMIDYTRNWRGVVMPDDENRFTFGMAIKAILPELGKHKLPFHLPLAKDNRLKKITVYLQENLSSQLYLCEIAQHFGLSERSLARLFQSDLRMSYIKYLRTLRMIYALELLCTTKLSVNEIAFRVGYDSFPTFSNTFFQLVGIRPKLYKSYMQQYKRQK